MHKRRSRHSEPAKNPIFISITNVVELLHFTQDDAESDYTEKEEIPPRRSE